MLAVILVIVGLFGVIGNTIAISILNRRDMESPNNFILKGRYMKPYIIHTIVLHIDSKDNIFY